MNLNFTLTQFYLHQIFLFFFFKSSHNVTEIQFGLAYYFIESVLIQFRVEHLAFHQAPEKQRGKCFFYTLDRVTRHRKSIADLITEHFSPKYHQIIPNRTRIYYDLQVFLHILYHLVLKTLGDRQYTSYCVLHIGEQKLRKFVSSKVTWPLRDQA